MSYFWFGVVCGSLATAIVMTVLRTLAGRAIDKFIAYLER